MSRKLTQVRPGQKFGRWKVIRLDHYDGRNWWRCKCKCGTVGTVRQDNLLSTKRPSRSCGCYKREVCTERLRPGKKQWTESEDKEVLSAEPAAAIAARLGRSTYAVECRRYRLRNVLTTNPD